MEKRTRFYALHSKHKGSLYTSFFVFFVDTFGWAIVFPLFAPMLLDPEYEILARATPESVRNIAIAIIFSAYPLMQFFGAPFFGEIADRLGRKKAFLIALGGVSIGYLLSGVALTFKSYSFLLITRLITGFFAGSISISLATIADLSSTIKERTKNFSLVAIFGGLAWVLSALVGGDLSDPHLLHYFRPSIPLFLAGVISAIAFFIVLKAFCETCTTIPAKPFKFFQGFKDLKTAFALPKIKLLFTAYLFWSIAWVMMLAWFAALSIEKFQLSQVNISYILTLNGLVWMGVSLFTYHYLASKFSLINLVLVGYLCAAVTALISILGNQVVYTLFFLLSVGFSALLWSTTLSLISLSAPIGLQGITLGVGQAVFSLGIIVGPLLAGYLSDIQISLSYYFASGLFFLACALTFLWKLRHKEPLSAG